MAESLRLRVRHAAGLSTPFVCYTVRIYGISEVDMRVWIVRRPGGGAYLPEPVRVGGTPAPFELLAIEVTD